MEKNMLSGIALGLSVCGVVGIAAGTPVQWKVADGGNGHAYDIVVNDTNQWPETVNGIHFKDAMAAATAMGGYLATPTMTGEAYFIYDHLVAPTEGDKNQRYWLGAYCSEAGDEYRWVNGDTVTSWGGYTRIEAASGDVPYGIVQGGEDGAALQDLPQDKVANGFIVEFDAPPPDPDAEQCTDPAAPCTIAPDPAKSPDPIPSPEMASAPSADSSLAAALASQSGESGAAEGRDPK